MSTAFIIGDNGAEGYRATRNSALTFPPSRSSEFDVNDQEPLPEKVVQLLHAIPSAEVLAQLAAIDPAKLPRASRVDYLTAIERQESWIQALMHRAVIAVAGRESAPGDDPIYKLDDSEREDVSTALRISPSGAQIKIDVARALTNHLPNTCSALAVGEISAAHADA